jgi:hypothetical protein
MSREAFAKQRNVNAIHGPSHKSTFTYHERLEVRPPPLRQAVAYLPVIVDPVVLVELL